MAPGDPPDVLTILYEDFSVWQSKRYVELHTTIVAIARPQLAPQAASTSQMRAAQEPLDNTP